MAGKPSPKAERENREVQAELTKLKAALKKARQTAKRGVEAERLRSVEVAEALEQQAATSEILRVIASSPTDIQPVLNVIVQHASQLCDAPDSALYRTDGKTLDLVAANHFTPEGMDEIRKSYPRPLDREGGLSALSILDRAIYHVPDVENDPRLPEVTRRFIRANGHKSLLFVPLMHEGIAIGALAVGTRKQKTFTGKQIALLQTFASQAVIAIENVRLFTETQRLLKETEQRAAELQIINSVQEGLASKLDVQAIYDLVGDKIRDIFHASGTAVQLFNHEQGIQYTPYCFLKERFTIEPHPYSGIAKTMLDFLRPRMYRNVEEYRAIGGQVLETGEEFKSGMNVPLMVGQEIIGMIHIASLDKENAYNDSDLRLLTTLANSMSVALESARLFDETQQRNAELAIINSIQQGLASKLDMQAIYNLVGDKVREIFNANTTYIAVYDPGQQAAISRYHVDNGVHFNFEPFPMDGPGLFKHVIRSRKPLLIGTSQAARSLDRFDIPSPNSAEDLNETYLGVPILLGDEVKGIISVQSYKQNAYNHSDVRLLQTLANSMSIALENARLWEQEKMFRKALQSELDIGREIQAGFLPEALPRIAGWEIAATLMSAREVAGDFYDAFELPDGTIGLVIADVCDKGVGAALFMTLFRSLIRAVANLDYFEQTETSAYYSTQERLQRAILLTNNYINETHVKSGMFATLFFGILDPRDGRFTYINGGHESPFILRADNTREFLRKTGPAVGVIPKFKFKILETHLQAGDMFFAFTDGVPDCRNPLGEFFGRERLEDLLQGKESANRTVENIASSLREYIGGANQFDDITLLAVRRS